jgi:capsular exopolysaccharide synthesis family protein
MGRVDAAMKRAAAAADTAGTDPVSAVVPEVSSATTSSSTTSSSTTSSLSTTAHDAESVNVDGLDAGVSRKVVVDEHMAPAAREQYRRLATALHQAQAESGTKVVMIASSVPSEGKTLTAANLAMTLSESYHRRVLLIDADLRRPALHRILKIAASPGLTESLLAATEQQLPVHRVSAHLSVLPAGKPAPDPMVALASPRLLSILAEARDLFDWVIVDTPPIGLLSDANLLASSVDGVIFVVKAGSTPYDLVKRGLEAVGSDRVLGVVLNRAATDAHRYGYGYQHYSTYHYNAKQDSEP